MQIILLERVPKLGQMGEVVSVKNGFGRNYLVPQGKARIRTQMSAAHTPEQIERAVEAFTRIGKQLGVIA